jgi:hypothetical protein
MSGATRAPRRARQDRCPAPRRRGLVPASTQRLAQIDLCHDRKGWTREYPRQRFRHRELPPFRPYRCAARCDRSGHIRTPRLLRPRVTSCGGRSPGSRVIAVDHLPRSTQAPSGNEVVGSPLTVAGAAAALCWSARTAFPFDPLAGNHRRSSCRVAAVASMSRQGATQRIVSLCSIGHSPRRRISLLPQRLSQPLAV